ncbi:MAG: hypothetical protein R3194_11790, partial [Limnobacter sp.]|nr:hypothetical protein [Limnobacter sp.]
MLTKTTWGRLCIWGAMAGVHGLALGQTETSDLPTWLTRKIEPVHYGLNEFVNNTSRGIDRFFGTDESLLVENQSFMKLSQTVRFASGDTTTDTSLRFRLDLPTTKKKLRLVLESNVSELDPLLGRNNNTDRNTNNIDNSESTLGLEQRGDKGDLGRWDGRVGAGVRLRSGLDPYVRYTASRRFEFDDSQWRAKSFNRINYFDRVGYQVRSNLDFNRPIDSKYSLRATTQVDWQQERGETSYIQSFELNHIIDQRNALRYAYLLLGDTAETPSLFDKVLQVYW